MAMDHPHYIDVLNFIRNQSDTPYLEKIIEDCQLKIHNLRQARGDKACKWGRCNGTIGPDKKCNQCGQGYV